MNMSMICETKIKLYAILLFVGIVGLFDWSVTIAASHPPHPAKPFPVHLEKSKTILYPDHLSQDKLDLLVIDVYEKWKRKYLISVKPDSNGKQLYRISAGKRKKNKTYSEGMGYGMLLTVHMAGYDIDAKVIFDGLWRFVKKNPSRVDKRFMAYQVPIRRDRRNSAFDGDADIALALLLADMQWGSNGAINYRDSAVKIIDALMAKVVGGKSRLPMLGDWVQQNGRKYNQYTIRSSDLLLSHFKIFSAVSTENEHWNEVVLSTQDFIEFKQTHFSPVSGLLPDFAVAGKKKGQEYKPAKGRFLEGKRDGQYYYNATRVPWRIGVDAILMGDQKSINHVRRIGSWVVTETKGKPDNIKPGYSLAGKPLAGQDYISKAFIAPLGIAGMVSGTDQSFVNDAFDLSVNLQQDYYEDSIGLLCLLLMTGNFWLPTL